MNTKPKLPDTQFKRAVVKSYKAAVRNGQSTDWHRELLVYTIAQARKTGYSLFANQIVYETPSLINAANGEPIVIGARTEGGLQVLHSHR